MGSRWKWRRKKLKPARCGEVRECNLGGELYEEEDEEDGEESQEAVGKTAGAG